MFTGSLRGGLSSPAAVSLGGHDHRPALDLLSTNAPQTRHAVTALIVAHDGARWLPGLVQALRAQTYPVEQTVAVDTGSRDRSGAVLAELIGQDAVFGMDRSTGYGEAVAVALRHAARRRSGTDRPEPQPGRVDLAAARRLRARPRRAGAAAAGGEQGPLRRGTRAQGARRPGPADPPRGGRLHRPGGPPRSRASTRARSTRASTTTSKAVLAVGSAGMLVRRDVWDQLGGFDPRLKLFRDDVDFCWRVQAAGYRVQVVTDAVLYHRELPRGGAGPSTTATRAGSTGATRCSCSPSTFRCCPCSGSSAAASPARWSAPPTSCSPSSLTWPPRTRSRSPGCSGTRSGSSRAAAAVPGDGRRATPRSACSSCPRAPSSGSRRRSPGWCRTARRRHRTAGTRRPRRSRKRTSSSSTRSPSCAGSSATPVSSCSPRC